MSSAVSGPNAPASWRVMPMNPDEAPWSLLLLADPSREKVKRYLRGSTCFAARQTAHFTPSGLGMLVGVAVLVPAQAPQSWELMNIAVSTAWQGHGVGSALLQRCIAWVREQGATRLEVGTGTFGDQLIFYQRAGFRVTGVAHDFFLKHYTTQLWEHGVQHKDMLRLALQL
ncbi:GNAT family N-acetyltransferase [Comamonas aquatilis]|uniref:GNAT family N-acetyltransferase n=1 Tax=Comamonas aquatilis TaxID=1778406 RepID=UPI0039F01C49